MTTTLTNQTLVAYQHNGFSVLVEGNSHSIDALKGLLIPNAMVKSIVIYEGETTPKIKVSALNYTQLKELRK